MLSKQEVESTESNLVPTALPYAANYSKFCSPSSAAHHGRQKAEVRSPR